MSKTSVGAAMVAPKPSLWWTESQLGAGLAALQSKDPDNLMTDDQARELVATFVSADAVIERRAEFAEFLKDGERLVELKRGRASELRSEADAIEAGLERMGMQATEIMKALGVKALSAGAYVLKLKDSPGSVIVDDETIVPLEFWRVRQDEDIAAIRRLVTLVGMVTEGAIRDSGMEGEALAAAVVADEQVIESEALLRDAIQRRAAVDKNLVKAEWKANGLTRDETDEETGEVTAVPMVPGTHKEVTTKLVVS